MATTRSKNAAFSTPLMTKRFETLILSPQLLVGEYQLPSAAVMGVALRASARHDDVDLRWAWMAEGRPVVTPLLFVERRIHDTQLVRGVRDVGNKDDQIDVLTGVVSQQRAARYGRQSLGHCLSDAAGVISDDCVQFVARQLRSRIPRLDDGRSSRDRPAGARTSRCPGARWPSSPPTRGGRPRG